MAEFGDDYVDDVEDDDDDDQDEVDDADDDDQDEVDAGGAAGLRSPSASCPPAPASRSRSATSSLPLREPAGPGRPSPTRAGATLASSAWR